MFDFFRVPSDKFNEVLEAYTEWKSNYIPSPSADIRRVRAYSNKRKHADERAKRKPARTRIEIERL